MAFHGKLQQAFFELARFTDAAGATDIPPAEHPWQIRLRKPGYQDLSVLASELGNKAIVMEPERDPAALRKRVETLEIILERSFVIPGINRPVGLDAIVGLVPVVGDVIAATMGAYLIWEARNLGMPKWKIWRMVGNLGVDTALGAIPLVGDAFVTWKPVLDAIEAGTARAHPQPADESWRNINAMNDLVLEILRTNPKLEALYAMTACRAFGFCLTYKRNAEFRRLCDILRQHRARRDGEQQCHADPNHSAAHVHGTPIQSMTA